MSLLNALLCLRGDEYSYIDFYSIHMSEAWSQDGRIRVLLPTVDRWGNRLPRFSALSFIRIWCLGQRHYISWAIDRPKFCPPFASRPYRYRNAYFFGRLIFRRTRHININSMYEICQNEFRLGAAAPNHHFSSRGECDLDVKYRCIIARAREEYQVGRFPLLLFQDNPFGRQAASYVTRDTITSICCVLLFIYFFFFYI